MDKSDVYLIAWLAFGFGGMFGTGTTLLIMWAGGMFKKDD